jgi:hypothetical protein
MTAIGTKYQMVIDRTARQRLGVQPGWVAVQTVVGDHLEVRFLPPEHDQSLAGSLSRYARRAPRTGHAPHGKMTGAAEKQAAWEAEARARWPAAE